MSDANLPSDWSSLPLSLPVPQDDGQADHLPSLPLPQSVTLTATSGPPVNLYSLSLERPILLFIYPRTGKPGVPNPEGWDDIPGARGCTPELCAVRDSISNLTSLSPKLVIFGLSSQSPSYQAEVAERLHLPYPILSDESIELTKALRLPTFEVNGEVLLKRATLFIEGGKIGSVDYPVFPSDQAAKRAEALLK